MNDLKSIAQSAIVVDERWDRALDQALAQIQGVTADVIFMFASSEYSDHFPEMIERIRSESRSAVLIGCSCQGTVGTDQELEDLPSISLLALSLPGATFHPVRITQQMIFDYERPQEWRNVLGMGTDDVNAWLVFADPFEMDGESLISQLSQAYPGLPMSGGLASGDVEDRFTQIFLNDEIYDDGAVVLGIGGAYTILPLVSQGCEPIGETWTITKVLDNGMIESISNRPAYDMLIQTFETLSPEMQRRAQRNLLVGLAADEYRDTFERGSFIIRQLLGVDRRTGALAINAIPRAGQTIQFQMRDATTADMDLRELLKQVRLDLGDNQPVAGILCTCNGRGVGMFGIPDHDAGIIARELGQMPLAGLFCNGEIGPVGEKTFLHGFTASLALFIKQSSM